MLANEQWISYINRRFHKTRANRHLGEVFLGMTLLEGVLAHACNTIEIQTGDFCEQTLAETTRISKMQTILQNTRAHTKKREEQWKEEERTPKKKINK